MAAVTTKNVKNLKCSATAAILNFFQPPKAATHYGGYSYKFSWSLMKGIQFSFEIPPFLFPWQLRQNLFWNFQNGRHCHGNGQNAKKN
jgi:hypothetical protein